MAKAKGATKTASGAKPTALTIRGDLKWRKWVESLADHCRSDVAKVVDRALIEYAKTVGFSVEAPKR